MSLDVRESLFPGPAHCHCGPKASLALLWNLMHTAVPRGERMFSISNPPRNRSIKSYGLGFQVLD